MILPEKSIREISLVKKAKLDVSSSLLGRTRVGAPWTMILKCVKNFETMNPAWLLKEKHLEHRGPLCISFQELERGLDRVTEIYLVRIALISSARKTPMLSLIILLPPEE